MSGLITEKPPLLEKAGEGLGYAPESGFEKSGSRLKNILRIVRGGIETHGITPVPPEQRTDERMNQMFFVWFSANFNIIGLSTGTAGPAFFDLGLRDSLLVLLVVDVITCAIPAAFAVFGPKLGMRGMIQCRFSFGYFGGAIPSILNVFTCQGYLILNCIVGGQTIASVSDHLNATLGIVIIGVLSLIVTLCGYRVMHWYESVAWIPNAIAIPILLGVGGKHLRPSSMPAVPPASTANLMSFGSLVASTVLSWCTFTPDYGVFHSAKASSMRIFVYTYLGFLSSSIVTHMIGAAIAAAAPGVPSWEAGFEGGTNFGGLINAIFSPAGRFGKFLVVILALTVPSTCAPVMYTSGLSAMSVAPIFARAPRFVYALISEAILIPIAIIGATRFYDTLVNILSLIGYWSSAFASIVLTEHFLFRHASFSPSTYPIEHFDQPRKLPPGIAAVVSFLGAFGLIIPCMSQVWYVGPIAKHGGTGDIGVPVGFGVAGLLYVVLRRVEKWKTKGSRS